MSGGPEPGAYPGNPSLPREVRDKILSTFRHTLNLYKEGKTDDCLIGCDFILKMDPRFAPARQLMEKAKNPRQRGRRGAASRPSSPRRRPGRSGWPRPRPTGCSSAPPRASTPATSTPRSRRPSRCSRSCPATRTPREILEKARQQEERPAAVRGRAAAGDRGARRAPRRAKPAPRSTRCAPSTRSIRRSRCSTGASRAPAPAAAEVGESTNPGLSLVDEPPPVAPPPRPGPPPSRPAPPPPPPAPVAEDMGGGLGDLSLDAFEDSSSAVVPPPDMGGNPATGPLSLSGNDFSDRFSGAAGGAPNLWSEPPADQGGLGDLSLDASPEPSARSRAHPNRPSRARREPAARRPSRPPSSRRSSRCSTAATTPPASGNRQQAIEIWSRIFLIDINNSEAVSRIEKARQEMAEGNKRVAEGLKRGRETFEAGDFTGAREAFLQVLALDENDATARSTSTASSRSSRARPPGSTWPRRLRRATSSPRRWPTPRNPSSRLRRPVSEAKPKKPPRARAPDGPQVPDGARGARSCSRSPSAATSSCGPARSASAGAGERPTAGRRSSTRPRSSATARSPRRSRELQVRSPRSTPTTRAPRSCSRRCRARRAAARRAAALRGRARRRRPPRPRPDRRPRPRGSARRPRRRSPRSATSTR